MKSPKGKWGELFNFDGEDEQSANLPDPIEASGEGAIFLEEAHEALLKLSQKTNKRGKMMKQPRRAESWQ